MTDRPEPRGQRGLLPGRAAYQGLGVNCPPPSPPLTQLAPSREGLTISRLLDSGRGSGGGRHTRSLCAQPQGWMGD